jgi:hypothetical protein
MNTYLMNSGNKDDFKTVIINHADTICIYKMKHFVQSSIHPINFIVTLYLP